MDLKSWSNSNRWQVKMHQLENRNKAAVLEVVLHEVLEDLPVEDLRSMSEGSVSPPEMSGAPTHWIDANRTPEVSSLASIASSMQDLISMSEGSVNSLRMAEDPADCLDHSSTSESASSDSSDSFCGRGVYTLDWKELLELKPLAVHILKQMMKINVTEDGCVKKMVLREGNGAMIHPGVKVCLHFVGFLMDNNGSSVLEPFASTLTPDNKPQIFKLHHGELIPGLNSVIKTMGFDEYAQILIEPTYAFGLLGAPPRIPANTTCVFNVRLMDYLEDEQDFSHISLSDSEFKEMTLDQALDAAKNLRAVGISHLATFHLQDAIHSFLRGIYILEEVPTDEEEDFCRCFSALTELRLLLAKTYLKGLKPNPKQACIQCVERLREFVSNEMSSQLYLTMAKAKYMLKDSLATLSLILEAKKHGMNNDVEDVAGFESRVREDLMARFSKSDDNHQPVRICWTPSSCTD